MAFDPLLIATGNDWRVVGRRPRLCCAGRPVSCLDGVEGGDSGFGIWDSGIRE